MTFLAGDGPHALTASAGYHSSRPRALALAVLALVALVIVPMTTLGLRCLEDLAWMPIAF